MFRADTVAELDKPLRGGFPAIISLGIWPDRVQENLIWNVADQVWIGKSRPLFGQTVDSFFSPSNQLDWGYFTDQAGTGLAASPGKFWGLSSIPYAGEKFAAGLDLQINLRARGRGGLTYAAQIAPWFFEFANNDKLSLNNDSSTVPFPMLEGALDVASNGPVAQLQPGTVLPADTTVPFALNCIANIPATFVAAPANPYFTANTGQYCLSIEHRDLDRPVRLRYTGYAANQFTGVSVAFDAAGQSQAAAAAKLNNLIIPDGAIVHQARLAPFAPSGTNPNAVTSWSGKAVAIGDGNIGFGPSLIIPGNVIIEKESGWQLVKRDGVISAGQGGFFKSFASGLPDLARPYTPTKRFLYATLYSRFKGVPNGTLTGALGGNVGLVQATVESSYRWIGIPA